VGIEVVETGDRNKQPNKTTRTDEPTALWNRVTEIMACLLLHRDSTKEHMAM
jgi:hypothetical protein